MLREAGKKMVIGTRGRLRRQGNGGKRFVHRVRCVRWVAGGLLGYADAVEAQRGEVAQRAVLGSGAGEGEMKTTIGYVLVSKTVHIRPNACGKPGCVDGFEPKTYRSLLCPIPERPGCHARCVRDPRELAQHPDCQQWQRDYDAWYKAHHHEEHTGGTRLGPLHHFGDCKTLLHRGPRRKDARIIEIDHGTAQDLGLPTCKECAARMRPFEKQFEKAEAVPAREP